MMIRAIITGALMASALITAHAADEGLAAWWGFEDSNGDIVKDRSGNGIDAAVIGTASWVAGRHGGGLKLSGNTYVDCGTSEKIDFTSDFSISFWIKAEPVSGGSGWTGLVSRYESTKGFDINLMTGTGNFEIGARGTPQIVAAKIGTPVIDDTWHHIVVVFTKAGFTLYQDGKRTAEKSGTWGPASTAAKFLIGKRAGVGSFTGVIDEVRVFSRALSENEAAEEFTFIPSAAVQKKPAPSAAAGSANKFLTAPDGTPLIMPTLGKEGVITAGDKMLVLSKGGFNYQVNGLEMFRLRLLWGDKSCYGEANEKTTVSADVNVEKREIIVRGKTGCPARPDAAFEMRAVIEDDGRIRIKTKFIDVGDWQFYRFFGLRFNKAVMDGLAYRDGGEVMTIGAAKAPKLTSGTVEFFTDKPDYAISFTPKGAHDLRDERPAQIDYWLTVNAEQETEVVIDMRKVSAAKAQSLKTETTDDSDPYQVAKYNRVELPNYKASRNLIQNPSFEEGLHGWEMGGVGYNIADPDHAREWLRVVSNESQHGLSSARIQLRKQTDPNFIPMPGTISPYTFQPIPGKKYTFSFYAKADEPTGVTMIIVTKNWGKWMHDKYFGVGTSWQRYTTTFTATDSPGALTLGIGWSAGAIVPKMTTPLVNIYIDSIQLEQAESASEFTVKPVSISLEGTGEVQYLNDAKQLSVTLINNTSVGRTVDAKVIVRDYYKREVFTKSLAGVPLASAGRHTALIDVPDAMDYVGAYSIKVVTKDSSGLEDYDFFRVMVINPFTKERLLSMKNRLIFSWGNPVPVSHAARARELGLGAFQTGGMFPVPKELYQAFDDEGILMMTGIFGDNHTTDRGTGIFSIFTNLRFETSLESPTMKRMFDSLPEYFRTFKHHKYWKYMNEPYMDRLTIPSIYNPKTHVEMMERVYGILKKEIPDAVVYSSDPWENHENARRWLGLILKNGGAKYFDILATHPYRAKPEQPDLEKDTEALIAMADENGFKGDIWYTEGGLYARNNIPKLGILPTKPLSEDGIRFSRFTGDIIGDRVGYSLAMRSFLTTLRYSDRVKMFLYWTSAYAMDHITGVPTELGTLVNYAANILGNAKFVRAYDYAKTTRTYVFDNGEGRGIAVLWDWDDALERRERAPYRFRLADAAKLKMTDSFGRPLAVDIKDGSAVFDIDFQPHYIRAKSVGDLTTALDRSRIEFREDEIIDAALSMSEARTLSITVNNRDTKVFSGEFAGTVNGISIKESLSIPPLAAKAITADVSSSIDRTKARFAVNVAGAVIANGKSSRDVRTSIPVLICERAKGSITIDGDLSDWKGYRPIPMGHDRADVIEFAKGAYGGMDDISAAAYLTYDDENLYLALDVKDNAHRQSKSGGGMWTGDSVQIFLDPFRDGTAERPNMYEDYAYIFGKGSAGDEVFRNLTPEKQVAFLENAVSEKGVDIKVVRDEAGKRTVYELRFPKKYIIPVPLKKGVIGLGIMINDADAADEKGNDARKSGVTTAPGKEFWKQPQNLSQCVFE
ncbi:MAG: LamG-like jellyroll fold domain-containing protein [Spirochaetota bacterium]